MSYIALGSPTSELCSNSSSPSSYADSRCQLPLVNNTDPVPRSTLISKVDNYCNQIRNGLFGWTAKSPNKHSPLLHSDSKLQLSDNGGSFPCTRNPPHLVSDTPAQRQRRRLLKPRNGQSGYARIGEDAKEDGKFRSLKHAMFR